MIFTKQVSFSSNFNLKLIGDGELQIECQEDSKISNEKLRTLTPFLDKFLQCFQNYTQMTSTVREINFRLEIGNLSINPNEIYETDNDIKSLEAEPKFKYIQAIPLKDYGEINLNVPFNAPQTLSTDDAFKVLSYFASLATSNALFLESENLVSLEYSKSANYLLYFDENNKKLVSFTI